MDSNRWHLVSEVPAPLYLIWYHSTVISCRLGCSGQSYKALYIDGKRNKTNLFEMWEKYSFYGQWSSCSVVSVLAFNSDDPSSYPAEVYSFCYEMLFEKNENKLKETGVGLFEKNINSYTIFAIANPCKWITWIEKLERFYFFIVEGEYAMIYCCLT